jgi:hypothetical protein
MIYLKDNFLNDNGITVPSHFNFSLAAISDEDYYKETFNFWNDVYGFNMNFVTKLSTLNVFYSIKYFRANSL